MFCDYNNFNSTKWAFNGISHATGYPIIQFTSFCHIMTENDLIFCHSVHRSSKDAPNATKLGTKVVWGNLHFIQLAMKIWTTGWRHKRCPNMVTKIDYLKLISKPSRNILRSKRFILVKFLFKSNYRFLSYQWLTKFRMAVNSTLMTLSWLSNFQ